MLLQRRLCQLLEVSETWSHFYGGLTSPLTSGSQPLSYFAASFSSTGLGWLSGLIWRQPAAALRGKCPFKQLIISR